MPQKFPGGTEENHKEPQVPVLLADILTRELPVNRDVPVVVNGATIVLASKVRTAAIMVF
jgi:hypothetical protein